MIDDIRNILKDWNWTFTTSDKLVYSFTQLEVNRHILLEVESVVGYCCRSYMSIRFNNLVKSDICCEIITKIENKWNNVNKKSVLKSLRKR